MSSKDNGEECVKGGILAEMADRGANIAYVPYCSSDGWMGDQEFNGWEMRGSRIALGVVEDVVARGGVETLVMAGGSAGGRGAAILLDAVGEKIDGVGRVLGFLDSPYYVEDDVMGVDFEGFSKQTEDVYNNFVKGGELEEDVVGGKCGAAYVNEEWKCLFGQFRFPFIESEYLLVADQFDGWQLSHDIHGFDGIEAEPEYTKEEVEAVEEFGKKQNALLGTLGGRVWASACYAHHVSEDDDGFLELKNSEGLSQKDALVDMLGGGEGGRRGEWVDEVGAFECCCVDKY